MLSGLVVRLTEAEGTGGGCVHHWAQGEHSVRGSCFCYHLYPRDPKEPWLPGDQFIGHIQHQPGVLKSWRSRFKSS